VLALRAIGPLFDRLGTMLVTLAVDGVALSLVAAVIGLIVPLPALGTSSRPAYLRPVALLTLAAVIAATAIAAGGASFRGQMPTKGPNVLLVSIDTLRADHLSAYGYPRETSPNLDALAREGVLFVDATSHSTWTLPAHVSMLTGLDPGAHGVLAREHRIQPYHHTLAERLRAAGYTTSAWVGTRDWGFVGSVYGFDAGFDRFMHFPHPKRFRSSWLLRTFDEDWLWRVEQGVGNARDEVTSVINWIAIERDAPFFAFVHFYDVHSKSTELPYEAPPPFRELFCEGDVDAVDLCDDGVCATDRLLDIARGWKKPLDREELEWARCLYDGGIAFVDHEVGRLLDAIEDFGMLDDTVVIVTSDHGEAFFEHDYPLHSSLHHEITRIPLIIRAKGAIAGKRANGVVRQSDLLPTILELAGVPLEGEVQGQSLVPMLTDWHATSDEDVLAFDDGFGGVMLRTGTKTLIQHSRARKLQKHAVREYYDLAVDPKQRTNLERQERDTVASLQLRMADRMRESEALRQRLETGESRLGVEISEEAEAGLRALGYVVGPDDGDAMSAEPATTDSHP
jgi:arylsulfatase A-like enzyme